MRPRAYPVWLALSAASSFMNALVWTIVAVYFVTVVEMNPFELVLVGTVMELTIFVFEVPTGVVADTYSRRLSIVISYALLAVAYGGIAATDHVGWVLAANVVLGLALTFESGALQAWVTDEAGGHDLERVFLAGSRMGTAGALVGIVVSVALALIDLRLAIAAGAVTSVAIAAGLALLMPERGFTPTRHEGVAAWRSMGRNALAGARTVRASAALLVIFVITFFYGASSEALDRLWEAHFIRSVGLPRVGELEPIVWFGIINFISLVLGIVVATVVLRRLKPTQPARTVEALVACDLVLGVALLAFALAGNFYVALAAYLVARRARALHEPFFTAWINQNTESRVRATVNSIVNQSDAVGEVGGGPMIGGLGALSSLRAALGASAVLLTPAFALYAHALRRTGQERVA